MASDRSIAKLALFFAVVACAIGGLAIMQNSGEVDVYGKFKSMGEEAKKVFQSAKEKVEAKTEKVQEEGGPELPDIFESEIPESFDGGPSAGADQAPSEPEYIDPNISTLEKIKGQIDKFEAMLRSEEGQDPQVIDNLKSEVDRFRDYTAKRGGPMMEQITQGLTDARDRIGDDSTDAAKKMREISDSIVKQLKEKAAQAKEKLPQGGDGEQ